MPIAQSGNMGFGVLGNPTTFFKRKYRWSFALKTPCGDVSENIVKVAARPQLNIEELELNFLHGKMWIPGRASWETMTVTYYDVSAGSNDVSTLYCWLKTVHEFDKSESLKQSSVPGTGNGSADGWAASASLYLYDGTGQVVETWNLGLVFPTSVQWGDLDYSNNEEVTIELTLRYSKCEYIKGVCMSEIPAATQVGCKK